MNNDDPLIQPISDATRQRLTEDRLKDVLARAEAAERRLAEAAVTALVVKWDVLADAQGIDGDVTESENTRWFSSELAALAGGDA